VAASSGRPRNRHSAPRYQARAGTPGPVAEHRSKIMAALAASVAVLVLVLGMTGAGHRIDAATQHFMLYYAGVFALIGLTASVGVGLIATDRVILAPRHRVMAQAVHRAVSFGALAFLIVHIVTEIMAQRVHVIDAFVPFLSPFRTFYIGLGTIASDLILLLVVTGIIRKRFTAHGKAWRWRAIHYTSYASFVFGVLHGLLAGRAAKPYVDWCYGFAIALVALGLVVRFLAISVRSKQTLSSPPGQGGASTSSLQAAALGIAQARLAGTMQVLPAGAGAGAAAHVQIGASFGSGFTPLGAPPFGTEVSYAPGPVSSLPASSAQPRQPLYEPGYVGPPRYEGASRAGTGPMPQVATGPMPRLADSGPMPRVANSGPMPRLADSGPMPRVANSGPMPRLADSGPMPRVTDSGPMPRLADSGPMPRVANSGPMPRLADSGPMPRVTDSGPMPRLPGSGPMPSAGPGAARRPYAGPRPGSSQQYPASQYSGGQYPASRHSAGQYPADQYPADQYPGDRRPGDRRQGGHYQPGRSQEDEFQPDRYPQDRCPDGQYPDGGYQGGWPGADSGPQASGSANSSGQDRRRPASGHGRHRDQQPQGRRRRDSPDPGGAACG